jgi:hypothetical protein
MPDHEFFLKDVSRRWKKEVAGVEEVIIFSPYITKPTSITVCSVIPERACRIYTQFTFLLFLNQSSSIQALIELKEIGHRIFCMENLHAKMVIVPGQFASIGSQNLTGRGTKSFEASTVITNETDVSKIYRDAMEKTAIAWEISMEMLLDMQRLVAPFEKKFKKLIMESEDIDHQVSSLDLGRTKKGEAEFERTRKMEVERLKVATEDAIKVLPMSKESIWCGFRDLRSEDSKTYGALCPMEPNQSLLKWEILEKPIRLERTCIYLCVLQESSKLGWLRVGKSRIALHYQYAKYENIINIGKHKGKINFEGIWPVDEAGQANLKATFWFGIAGAVEVTGWFSIDGFEVKHVSKIMDEVKGDKQQDTYEWAKANPSEVEKLVIEYITGPFDYHRHLDYVSAYDFFNPARWRKDERILRLSKVGESPVLIARKPRY